MTQPAEPTPCLPAVGGTWTRRRDAAALTVTDVTTTHGRTNVHYDISYPDRPDITEKGFGISDLDHFLAHNTEAPR